VLTADPGTNALGRVAVQAMGQTVELASEREMTRIVPDEAPSTPATLPEEEFKERFGAVLASRAPDPLFVQLYFESGGNRLVPESQALLDETVVVIRNRPVPDVVVIGHTDTTGDAAVNARVGLQRATLIRDRLIAAGVPAAQVDATSHGEADLLVPTADNVAEARNRRVEITVR
jgi:outer membrane protein OmpA-like peptidoglycan-associated protein